MTRVGLFDLGNKKALASRAQLAVIKFLIEVEKNFFEKSMHQWSEFVIFQLYKLIFSTFKSNLHSQCPCPVVKANQYVKELLDNTSLPLLVQMYCYRNMAPTSSPYAIFRASDWNSVVAEPIGLRQCLRIAPKKFYHRSVTTPQRSGTISKKPGLNRHVQLAFA